MATQIQKANHIARVRQAVTELLAAQNSLKACRSEWDALGLGTALQAGDFTGDNEGLLPAHIASVFTTMEAVAALMAQGHATNLYKVGK